MEKVENKHCMEGEVKVQGEKKRVDIVGRRGKRRVVTLESLLLNPKPFLPLQSHESEKEARAAQAQTMTSEVDVIPSPRPLDIASLTQLIQKTSLTPAPTPPPLTSLESCLSSLKAEVKQLQSRLKDSNPPEGELNG